MKNKGRQTYEDGFYLGLAEGLFWESMFGLFRLALIVALLTWIFL